MPREGRPAPPNESPGLLPHGYHDERDFEDFLDNDLRARRKLTGSLAGGRPLNMKKLIARFGGPTMLHQRLISRGFRISIKAVEKWRERGRMSTDWLNELVIMAAEEGKPLMLENYIVGFPSELKHQLVQAYLRRKSGPIGQLRADYLEGVEPKVESLLE